MDLSSILSGGIDKIVDSVGSAVDKIFTNDEEKLQLKNALVEIKIKAQLETENNYLKHEQEITKRWQSDNEHIITRAVRPGVVIWSFFLLTVVMVLDGNIGTFTVKEAYIPILETIVITVTIAYFGSRGVEKTAKVIKDK